MPSAPIGPVQQSRWRSWLPLILVGLLIAVAVTLVALARFRRGTTVLSVALLLTAVLRLLLPADRMGPLAVRGRVFDVLFCTGLGGFLLWLVFID